MFDLLLGPLGGVLAAAMGFLGLWVKSRLDQAQGAADATAKRDAQSAAEYIAERKRQDEVDVGHGATDAERIGLLEAIRDRKRTGKD
jgi:hypothetical protein